jgi:AraC family transcriptional regulator
MSPKNLRVADVNQLETMSQIMPGTPVTRKQFAQWDGIALAHCYHSSLHEFPEHQWMQHLIGIGGTGTQTLVEHRLDGKFHKHSYQSHEIIIIPANVSYSAFWQQEREFSLLSMAPSFLEKIARSSVKATQIELIPQFILVDSLVQQILLALHDDLVAGHPTGHLFGESLAVALATRLLQNHAVWKIQYSSTSKGLPLYLQERALEFIESHLDRPFSLTQLADALGMSVYYFCRQFKLSMGVAPHQYVTRRRIEKAKNLLWHSQLPITDIALQVGFETPSAFSRLFRQFTGTTPKDFRQQR